MNLKQGALCGIIGTCIQLFLQGLYALLNLGILTNPLSGMLKFTSIVHIVASALILMFFVSVYSAWSDVKGGAEITYQDDIQL